VTSHPSHPLDPHLRGAEYCDNRVCLSVCLSVGEHISGTTCPIFANFYPRDAMLARVLGMALCLSVSVIIIIIDILMWPKQ